MNQRVDLAIDEQVERKRVADTERTELAAW